MNQHSTRMIYHIESRRRCRLLFFMAMKAWHTGGLICSDQGVKKDIRRYILKHFDGLPIDITEHSSKKVLAGGSIMRNEDSKAKNEWAIDAERRSEKRLKVENEFTLTVIPGGRNLSKEKIIYTLGRDISFCGARIQSRSFLPVDTLLDIKVAFNHPFRMMSALGKVKWIKSLFADEFYEAGLEFVSRPR